MTTGTIEMDAHQEHEERVVELAPEGELTIYQAQEIRQHFLGAVGTPGGAIECDLSGVSELDTAGFQLLVQLKRQCTAAGRELRLKRHSDAVLEVLSLYCAEQYFGDPLVLQGTDSTPAGTGHEKDAPQ